MKYRIIEVRNGYYPQEKQCFLYKWEYIDNLGSHYTWDENRKYHSYVSTWNEAVEVIQKRKNYLKDKNFKIIHNL